MKKALPIGYDNFKEIIDKNLYYVDKTNIIEELLIKKSKVTLFPRPRRFGKSLLLSTIDNFFNIEYKNENKHLFDNLNISKSKYINNLSTKPVIKIDFKSLKQDSFDEMYEDYKEIIRQIFISKKYLKEDQYLDKSEIELYDRYLNKSASLVEYKQAISLLSEWLYRYYNEKVIILIDEYDVPIQQGYLKNFYENIVSFIRTIFSNTLKGNDFVETAIMTGVLRVSKESLFSDLNNVDVYGIIDKNYNEYFGFTENETNELLKYYALELTKDIKDMYNGYNFNGTSIYNPWSIINYANRHELIPYWVNTSGNDLIKDILIKIPNSVKITFERLLQGEEVAFRYDEKVTFLELNYINNVNTLINFLLVSGYLTLTKNYDMFANSKVVIPNNEVKGLFYRILESYLLDNYIELETLISLQQAFTNNNKEVIEKILNKNLTNLSFYDTKENFYHGFVLGMFNTFFNDKYIIKSNREAGCGRFDIMIRDINNNLGIIIEFKIADNNMEMVANKAIEQMKNKEYYQKLLLDKVKIVYEYAIVFKGKECIVR
ncbi:MAG: AAA family ATPase [Bacilli bacterium]|nr:AAA family ATPase [Bacilli bacterium]